MKKIMMLLAAAGVLLVVGANAAQAETTKQTATQYMRSQTSNGTKRSFEIDLKKFAPKDATSQRMAGNAQRKLKKGTGKNNRKIQGRKRVSRDQKNFGSLNR